MGMEAQESAARSKASAGRTFKYLFDSDQACGLIEDFTSG